MCSKGRLHKSSLFEDKYTGPSVIAKFTFRLQAAQGSTEPKGGRTGV